MWFDFNFKLTFTITNKTIKLINLQLYLDYLQRFLRVFCVKLNSIFFNVIHTVSIVHETTAAPNLSYI